MMLTALRETAAIRQCGCDHVINALYHVTAVTSGTPAVVSDKAPTFKDDIATAKPFGDIPGPKGLPFIGNIFELMRAMKEENYHKKVSENFAKFGPIYKEKVGSLKSVYILDVSAIEKLHRLEGKYPRRIIIEPWRFWRDEQGLSRGILTEDGPDWKRMRSIVDKQMLRPRHVATYAESFNEVISDFITRLRVLRQGLTVPNIDHELFHWSIETIGTVLYEVRLGGLSDSRSPEIARFIQAVQDVFATTSKVVYLPVKLNRIFLPKHQKHHEESWRIVYETSRRLVDAKFTELQASVERGEVASGFLSSLLSTQMSKAEVYANISELMLGAVDTTSNTMQWVLYEVSRRADIQAQLHAEISSVVPAGSIPSYEHLSQMSLLKAIIKEVLRLYPVANVASRVLNDDMVLCGYHIPTETTVLVNTYVLGRDPQLYPEPDTFRPERWLRSQHADAVHTFGWLPFGFGPRMCIGRRVAELEMHLLLARICQQFELKPVDDKPLNVKMRGLLVPERAVNVQFVDRH